MRYTQDKEYWVWLSAIPEVGSKRFTYLIRRFDSPKGVWESSASDIRSCTRKIGERAVNNIIMHKNKKYLDKAIEWLQRNDISIVTLNEAEYPAQLKNIYDPPAVLYYKGNFPESNVPSIAVVGSRNPSSYGMYIAQKLSYELASAGIVVVSGLARGIDGASHSGALNARGHTIGVLGCGIDVLYPLENKRYYDEMAEKGTIVSEYPIGTKPIAGNFPARNRIISGLSQGVLVIEARERSGALITAEFALEQGRDVYAVPGNINSPCSQGTNKLIKDGAKPVTCVNDIIEELQWYNPNIMDVSNDQAKDKQVPLIQLDFFESQVYNALENGQKHIDEISRITGIEIGRLGAILTILEIKGIIKQLPGKIFIKQWKA